MVQDGGYTDPYRIADEVRFVECAATSLANRLNAAVAATSADVVHFVLPGLRVRDGWTAGPLARFADAELASVCPLIQLADSPRTPVAGVRYVRSGGRGLRCLTDGKSDAARLGVLGPSLASGFYRKSYFELCGGFEPGLGAYADVDLAMSLQRLEFRTAIDPTSVLAGESLPGLESTAFLDGLSAERLYRRHRPPAPRRLTDWLHGSQVLWETCTRLPHWALARLAGRLRAWSEEDRYEEYARQMVESAKVAVFLRGQLQRRAEELPRTSQVSRAA